MEPGDLDMVELQDNTVFYELAFPEDWGLCQPGEAERLVEKGETPPDGPASHQPPAAAFSPSERRPRQLGVFQVCELTWQLRGEAGAPGRSPNAKSGLGADPGPRW